MKTELLGQEKNVVKVKVEFEPEEFKAALDKTIREIAAKANIPGFRKGHTPRGVIEMRYGKNGLYAETVDKLIPDAVEQVINDYELETIDVPSLDMCDIDKIDESEPLSCELTFEVMPEVTLPELDSIEVEKLKPEVTDAMVDKVVDEFKMQYSTLKQVERPVEDHDVVSVYFINSIEGSPATASKQEQDEIDMANPSIPANVKQALLGKSVNEKAEVVMDFDEDYNDKNLAGKKVSYNITINKVNERILPVMDPKFYKTVFNMDLDSEAAFKDEIRKRLHDKMDADNKSDAINKAVELISERAQLDVPETLVEKEFKYTKEHDAQETKRRYNKELDEFLKESSLTMEDYEKRLRERSAHTVRRTLVLDEVGSKFSVEVQKEEIDAKIAAMAAQYNMEPAKLRPLLLPNRNALVRFMDDIRYEKIVKLISEKVKIKEVDKLTAEEK